MSRLFYSSPREHWSQAGPSHLFPFFKEVMPPTTVLKVSLSLACLRMAAWASSGRVHCLFSRIVIFSAETEAGIYFSSGIQGMQQKQYRHTLNDLPQIKREVTSYGKEPRSSQSLFRTILPFSKKVLLEMSYFQYICSHWYW